MPRVVGVARDPKAQTALPAEAVAAEKAAVRAARI